MTQIVQDQLVEWTIGGVDQFLFPNVYGRKLDTVNGSESPTTATWTNITPTAPVAPTAGSSPWKCSAGGGGSTRSARRRRTHHGRRPWGRTPDAYSPTLSSATLALADEAVQQPTRA